jgi:hypothetical protein
MKPKKNDPLQESKKTVGHLDSILNTSGSSFKYYNTPIKINAKCNESNHISIHTSPKKEINLKRTNSLYQAVDSFKFLIDYFIRKLQNFSCCSNDTNNDLNTELNNNV